MNVITKIFFAAALLNFAPSSAGEVALRLLTPDGLKVGQGTSSSFQVMMANQSPDEQLITCSVEMPEHWESPPAASQEFYLPPHTAQIVPLTVKVPEHASKGTYRIAIGVAETDSQALLACDQLLVVVP